MNDVADVVQTFHGGCPHDCPDTCAMQFHVKNGELVSVSGNPDHPMTRGGLCVKLKDYEKRHYHPNRLLYPMKRVGPKGTNQFERITWDEALDTIVDRWQALINHEGPRAILPVSYLGNQGLSSVFITKTSFGLLFKKYTPLADYPYVAYGLKLASPSVYQFLKQCKEKGADISFD